MHVFIYSVNLLARSRLNESWLVCVTWVNKVPWLLTYLLYHGFDRHFDGYLLLSYYASRVLRVSRDAWIRPRLHSPKLETTRNYVNHLLPYMKFGIKQVVKSQTPPWWDNEVDLSSVCSPSWERMRKGQRSKHQLPCLFTVEIFDP